MRLLLFNLATDTEDSVLGFTTDWIRCLAARVERIHVITMRIGEVDLPKNVCVYSVGKERGYSEPRRVLEFYRHLFRVLSRDPIDVCFSHMIPVFTILAAPVLKLRRVPIITWYAHRHVTTVLKLAHHVSDRIVSIDGGSYLYSHDKLVQLGHGINTQRFAAETTAGDDIPLALSVGRLSPIKDLITFVDAIHQLRRDGLQISAAIVGGTSESDEAYGEAVRERVGELGLREAIQFVGPVPYREVVAWYRRCLVHVNLCPAGALDKAALEAMACGKVSMVANESFRQTLGQYADRLLFRWGDAIDLAERLRALLATRASERETIGRYLRARALELHSLDRTVDKLVNVFDSAIERRRGIVANRSAR